MTLADFNVNSDQPFVELLRADDLSKSYDDETAIANVSFSVAPGEILGIVGPNGAGKTTLLEVLAGLIASDPGKVLWRGETLPELRRKEAMFYMPDGIRPYQDRFAVDVVSFFSSVYKRSQAVISNTIVSVELAPILSKRVSALSKGYNRRLLLAIGLLAPQDVLLMDEPFDGFDIRQSRNIIQVLRHVAAGGRTLILAIHQLADAERVCDRFLLLSGGKVRGVGTLRELRTQTTLPGGSLEDIFLALS